jgi:phosphatidylglycerol lysyltransferase
MSEDAVVDLSTFTLSGKRRSNIRHSVTSARRAGMTVVPWSPAVADGVRAVSDAWVAAKRGPEAGFIVGRFEPDMPAPIECRVALEGDGSVAGFVTWRPFDDGRGMGLDLMRRRASAPNPTIDLLVADGLLTFAEAGLRQASLGCVQHAHGDLLERVYPTRPLHRYKDKYAPEWEPRWMVVPSRRHLPGAALALFRASVPGGLIAMATQPPKP